MTFKEAKEIFINRGYINGLFDGDKWRQSVVVISKWLEQESCGDYISREEVIKAIDRHTFEYDDVICLDDDITCILEDIPSVQSKTGHWVKYTESDYIPGYKCSECGYINDWKYNFCPKCGVKMIGLKHKCRTCTHCDIEHLICTPNSNNCKSRFTLDAEDLDTEEACDSYEPKREE